MSSTILRGTIHARGSLKGTMSKTVHVVDPVIIPLAATQNGEYKPPEGVHGFGPVMVDVIGGDVEEYKGAYEVTPTTSEQVLATARKTMRDDVTIKEIPYAEVENLAGGTTIIIG